MRTSVDVEIVIGMLMDVEVRALSNMQAGIASCRHKPQTTSLRLDSRHALSNHQ